MPSIEILVRLGVAFLLGGLVGLEREIHGRPAGLRTHILVAFGSALLTVVSIYGFMELDLAYDPGRIAAQVVSGIGFLGAGTILREGVAIKGLTTAASLWMVAAIGLASGVGMHLIAMLSTLMVLVVLTLLHPLETKFESGRSNNELEVSLAISPGTLNAVLKLVRKHQGKIAKLQVDCEGLSLHVLLRTANPDLTEKMLEEFAQIERASYH